MAFVTIVKVSTYLPDAFVRRVHYSLTTGTKAMFRRGCPLINENKQQLVL